MNDHPCSFVVEIIGVVMMVMIGVISIAKKFLTSKANGDHYRKI